MFEGTVFENIAYGNIDASTEDVWNAARLSESDKFISELPNKKILLLVSEGRNFRGTKTKNIYCESNIEKS
ncbi:MAG: hypothetical protein Ct9H90mP10_09500 [Actinomycetota bacterium]|nr:MAG: hypothetical protein Ct9H90mP10_09500 [Actinomycetota bacterium]